MVIAIVAIVIFFVIVFALRHVMLKRHAETDPQKRKGVVKNADIISLGALIVSIAVTGIYPFLQSPLLDYSVQQVGKTIQIKISNDGLVAAKHVIVSIDTSIYNIPIDLSFTKFESTPFLAYNLNNSNK